ncbi:ABC-F family ATP-binding cassette domain-containing protein [Sanyastnella coralliicola]|uniref:ABC-F family ATP-binding cassette domain-containing protein n=1 Tax=Sanyastnella coralliicola TaxID=3069118 RepID=UPI0027BB1590|nr:ABC-F family ATP-binding cassette domain-containing protein [Longitalea sp. SCSIO 12813]
MLTIGNLNLSFGQRQIFSDLSLFISDRECVGLTGRNGAGKTTLLRVIAKQVNPTSGSVTMPKGATIGFLEQEMTHNEQNTIREEAASAFSEVQKIEGRIEEITAQITERSDYESPEYHQLIDELSELNDRLAVMGGVNIEEKAQRVLQGLGFNPEDMDRTMSEFSGGWKMRVELAKLLLQNPDLLLLDEPTNHLDIESIEWLEGFLKTYSGAIVLISHDKAFLDALTKRTLEVTSTRIYDFKANYSKYMEWRADEIERQTQAQKNQQKYIEDTKRNIEKFRAKKNKAAFAQTLIRKLDKLERIEVDSMENIVMKFSFPPAPRSGKVVVKADSLVKNYGDLHVFHDVNLIMARQEKVALVGKNGAGKSTLTRIIMGTEPHDGDFELGHNVEIGYYAQNQTEELDGNKTVFQTLDDEAQGEIRKQLRSILGAFLFSGEDIDKKVKVLSGGEKARLALCKLLLKPSNLLILDEPTNHLDMRSKDVLKQALMDYDGSLIIVSHDRDFLSGLTEQVYEVTKTGLKQYIGDIREFLNVRRAQSIAAYEADVEKEKKAKAAPSDQKLSYQERKERERQKRKLTNRISKCEREIEESETRIAELDEAISLHDYSDKEGTEKLLGEYNELKAKVEELMATWEAAEEELSTINDESED